MASQIVEYEDRAEIVTARGDRFVIDLEDVEKAQGRSWYITTGGYAATGRETVRLHRLLLDAPKGMEVDHIDGDLTNNMRVNLRLCTRSENGQNQRKHRDNTSGFKGVSWHKQRKYWVAHIRLNRKLLHLGCFDTAEQASAAYQAAAERLFGDFKRAQEHE
jgi:HNH endonuclease/AP2 domain